MKTKRLWILTLLASIVLASGCHELARDDYNRHGWYRDGYRDGREYDTRRDTWRDRRYDERRDGDARRW